MKKNIPTYPLRISTCPLRILVVENLDDLRKTIVDLLKESFRSALIVEARSRAEARYLILQAYTQGEPYDIAILDLQLPEEIGGIESRDTSLASLIIDKFGPRATRLIQWTAYPADRAIPVFEQENRVPQSGIVYEVISKRDGKGPQKIEDFVNRLIAEKTVGQWLDDPYFKQMRDRSLVVTSRPGISRAPVDIPAYIHALIGVWAALEPHRKLEALTTFQGTEWELKDSEGDVKLVNERSAQALADAEENTRIFTKLTESDSDGK